MKYKFLIIIATTTVLLIISSFFVYNLNKSNIAPQINSRCYLQPDAGHCEAMFPKYYYDEYDKVCKKFIWGGCGGVVPFEGLEDCKEACEKELLMR